jgi:hypothetical protein
MSIRDLVRRIPKEPLIALPGVRRLWRRFPIGSVHVRTRYDIWDRPASAYGVFSTATLARSLGISRISALEFGVARGVGLLVVERICDEIAAELWDEGFYAMDEPSLRARLHHATLILGDVKDTVDAFVRAAPDPIGFVSFDLD